MPAFAGMTQKRGIPAFAGMTQKRDSRLRGNDTGGFSDKNYKK